jgi:phosphoenolpyruvate synthase/pyruvate phosphate dikinase
MSYYLDFVNTGTWTVDLGSGEGTYTFQETLDAWIADPEFQTDGGLRSSRLLALQSAMHAAPVDDALIAALGDRILEVFGSDTVMVRLRSSSNAEDSLGFSGAGLYDSSSVCLADELDGDSVGPSRCDPDKDDERTIRDGIRETWASLWNNRAWEERAWYGVDPSKVAMGILVNTRSNDEQANAVAFSGNPTDISDGRYLINAQEGELEVVSADPGVTPERLLVTVVDGEVTDVDRLSESSEVPAGEVVLDEVELAELAAVLFEASLVFPQDDTVPEGNDVIWDTEWKVDTDGQVKIKQIRPYLR